MKFQDAVRKCLTNYATFTGRAARPEFWWFALFLFAGNIVLSFIDSAIFGDASILAGLFTLATIIPAIAVSVRRLHDIGKSGWWVLLHLIPIIGFLVMLYFYVQPTEPGENEYGLPPQAV